MLHFNNYKAKPTAQLTPNLNVNSHTPPSNNSSEPINPDTSTSLFSGTTGTQILLATALVYVIDAYGKLVLCRAVLTSQLHHKTVCS